MFRRRILIIDDNDRYSDYLRTELIMEGHDACIVNNGNKTVEFLQEAPYPELILTSCPLSDDVIKQLPLLQTQDECSKTIPVVQLYSHNTNADDSDRCDTILWPKFPPVKLVQTIHEIFTCER